MKANIISFVGFQIGWFGAILGAARGWTWLGPSIVSMLLVLHLAGERRRGPALAVLLLVGVLGYLVDSALVLGGVFTFPEAARLGGPSTLWMVSMWVNLAIAVRGCMAWMRGRWLLAAVLGAISGPLSYWAGARLGAIELTVPVARAIAVIGVEWVIAFPLLIWLLLSPQLRWRGREVAA